MDLLYVGGHIFRLSEPLSGYKFGQDRVNGTHDEQTSTDPPN